MGSASALLVDMIGLQVRAPPAQYGRAEQLERALPDLSQLNRTHKPADRRSTHARDTVSQAMAGTIGNRQRGKDND
jgi:hypothetical protein